MIMARIIQTREQTDALKSVRSDLKSIKNINDFIERVGIIEADNITFSASVGGVTVKIPFDKKTVAEFLNKQKQKMQKDISANTSRFYITLDDTDKAILGS